MNRTSFVALALVHHRVIAERHAARAVSQEAATIQRRRIHPLAHAALCHAQQTRDDRCFDVPGGEAQVRVHWVGPQLLSQKVPASRFVRANFHSM